MCNHTLKHKLRKHFFLFKHVKIYKLLNKTIGKTMHLKMPTFSSKNTYAKKSKQLVCYMTYQNLHRELKF